MALRSRLMAGDSRLERCAVSDADHVTPGSRGDFVAKIQIALNIIDNAGLVVDSIYGGRTAQAVLDFKNAPQRRILQSYQTQADNIVGKRTIAALDAEVAVLESAPPGRMEILPRHATARPSIVTAPADRSSLRLAFSIPGVFADVVPPNALDMIPRTMRITSKTSAQVVLQKPGGNATISLVNIPNPKRGFIVEKSALLRDGPGDPDGLIPIPRGAGVITDGRPEKGGLFFHFRKEDREFTVDGYMPGSATIVAVNALGQTARTDVTVRANPAPADKNGPTITKAAPGSAHFSSHDSEPSPNTTHQEGRPVIYNRVAGKKLINLGGEGETPDFLDYQVDVSFSGYRRQGGTEIIFRPLFDDPEPNVGLAAKCASHICMRGTPLNAKFIAAIRHLAAPGCFFTFGGTTRATADAAVKEFGGPKDVNIIEKTLIDDGMVLFRIP